MPCGTETSSMARKLTWQRSLSSQAQLMSSTCSLSPESRNTTRTAGVDSPQAACSCSSSTGEPSAALCRGKASAKARPASSAGSIPASLAAAALAKKTLPRSSRPTTATSTQRKAVSIRLSWSRSRLELIEFHASQPPSAPAPPSPANQNNVSGCPPSVGPNARAAPQEQSTASAARTRRALIPHPPCARARRQSPALPRCRRVRRPRYARTGR